MFGLQWDSLHNLLWLLVILVIMSLLLFLLVQVARVVNTLSAYHMSLITVHIRNNH